jgi:hypothetical protein
MSNHADIFLNLQLRDNDGVWQDASYARIERDSEYWNENDPVRAEHFRAMHEVLSNLVGQVLDPRNVRVTVAQKGVRKAAVKPKGFPTT